MPCEYERSEQNRKEAQKKCSISFPFCLIRFWFAYNAAPSTKLAQCQCVFVVQSFSVLFSTSSLLFFSFSLFGLFSLLYPFRFDFTSYFVQIYWFSFSFSFEFRLHSPRQRLSNKKKKKEKILLSMKFNLRILLKHAFEAYPSSSLFLLPQLIYERVSIKIVAYTLKQRELFFLSLFNGSVRRRCAYSVHASSQYRITIAKNLSDEVLFRNFPPNGVAEWLEEIKFSPRETESEEKKIKWTLCIRNGRGNENEKSKEQEKKSAEKKTKTDKKMLEFDWQVSRGAKYAMKYMKVVRLLVISYGIKHG